MRRYRALAWFLNAVILAGLVAVNAAALVEAYGSGPPYYGMTENMDKWASPLPLLAAVNGAGLVLMLGIRLASGRLARRAAPEAGLKPRS